MWLSGEKIRLQCRTHRLDPWVGKISWRRKRQPTPVFLTEILWTKELGALQSMSLQKSFDTT